MIFDNPWFFRSYGALPQGFFNRAALALMQVRRPRWAVKKAIATWIRVGAIDMSDYEDARFATLEEFFLRRLREQARPLGPGLVSPVDGFVVAEAALGGGDPQLEVKGRPISVRRLVNGRHHDLALDDFVGGRAVSIFLTPHGYHRIHMPFDGELVEARWIPGRWFPQNELALQHIDGVYERNERLVLRCRLSTGAPLLMVMIAASLVGGIHLEGRAQSQWMRREPVALGRRAYKGDEIAHFSFGSTVVLIVPGGMQPAWRQKQLWMGEPLFAL